MGNGSETLGRTHICDQRSWSFRYSSITASRIIISAKITPIPSSRRENLPMVPSKKEGRRISPLYNKINSKETHIHRSYFICSRCRSSQKNVLVLLDETIGMTPDNVKDHLEHVAPCIRTSPITYDRFILTRRIKKDFLLSNCARLSTCQQ